MTARRMLAVLQRSMRGTQIVALSTALSLVGDSPAVAQEPVSEEVVVPSPPAAVPLSATPVVVSPSNPAVPPAQAKPLRNGTDRMVFGSLFTVLGAGAVVAGNAVIIDAQRAAKAGERAFRDTAAIVGAGLFVTGAVFMVAGIWGLGSGVKMRRAWQRERATGSVAMRPAVGRSARGTWTAGLELRF